jgi:hypothetical protein
MLFILIGTNSIFEKFTNFIMYKFILETVIECLKDCLTLEQCYENCIRKIYINAIMNGVTETLTCMIIFLERLKRLYNSNNIEVINNILQGLNVKDEKSFSHNVGEKPRSENEESDL